MEKQSLKLKLTRETVRNLVDTETRTVEGGSTPIAVGISLSISIASTVTFTLLISCIGNCATHDGGATCLRTCNCPSVAPAPGC